MGELYPYFLTIHLICAILFLGFVFCDVAFLSPIRKKLGDEFANKMWMVISQKSKWMPFVFLLLIVTGFAMLHQYIGKAAGGYFTTTLQQLLLIKVALALSLAFMVAISLGFYYILKRPSPFRNIIHPIALVVGGIIVILAKMAFYF